MGSGAANQLPGERGFLGQVEDDATGLVYLNARCPAPTGWDSGAL